MDIFLFFVAFRDTTSSRDSTASIQSSESGAKKPPPVAKKSFKSPVHKVSSGGVGGTLPHKKKTPRAHTVVGDQHSITDGKRLSDYISWFDLEMITSKFLAYFLSFPGLPGIH